ncbi:c-type cytochrome [Marinicellulosiphila megalodicopiae]|uniref:c-type cytochrome n=1 Tax=Marinicellulosiphila megalodicopiae TaxID=2724896 RepID=UPI003BB09B1F
MSKSNFTNTMQLIVMLCLTVFLVSCGVDELKDEFDSDLDATDQQSDNTTTDWEFSAQLVASGEQIYIAQCTTCHASDGSLPSNGKLIGCASCSNQSTLSARISTTMPPSDSELVTGSDADAVAAYVLTQFNSEQANHDTTESSILKITNKESAYKMAFDLVSKVPTADEVAAFEAGNRSEVLDQWLDSEAFYTRLMDIYNDQMHTDRFHSKYERESNYSNGRDLLTLCDRGRAGTCNNSNAERMRYYPDIYWWEDLPYEGLLADLTNDAIANEPLQIIRYVAKNDRPFSEILTADYALVNAFSARVLHPNTLDGEALSLDAFDKFAAPLIDVEFTDEQTMEVSTIQVADVTEIKAGFKTLNLSRSSDLQLRPSDGTDSDFRDFLVDYPHDPSHFIPVKVSQNGTALPHAGILSTPAFLNLYTTTPTNMNRARARFVYKLFAATDILAIEGNRDASVIDFSDSIGSMDPTKTNEDCLVCHRRIDPVADAFKNWLYSGAYKNSACSVSSNNYECTTIPSVGIGFEGTLAPVFGTNSVDANALQWLAGQVTQNPLFAKSVASTLFTGFTGREVLSLNNDMNNAYQASYEQQQTVINAMVKAYNDSGENVKAAVKVLLTSDYYLADAVEGSQLDYQVIGSDRLLSPDRIQAKIHAITGHLWSQVEVDDSFRMHLGNRSTWRLYGGVDHNNTKTAPNEQGGIMVAMQQRMANEIACFMTAQDFYRTPENRKLFELIAYEPARADTEENFYIATETQVKQTLVNLHLTLWHQEVAIDSDEVDMAYQLYQSVLQLGQQKRLVGQAGRDLSYLCRVDYDPDSNELLEGENRVYKDTSYAIRTWAAVLNYFLKDFEFSHL